MSIRPSAGAEVRALIESLASDDDIKREGAIARLAVIGSRAVDRLLTLYAAAGTTRQTQIAILRVLESVADARAIPIARQALHEGGDVGVAAAGALRAFLASATDASTASLDALVATALDRKLERRVRMAAHDALQDMPADIRARVNAAVLEDADPEVVSPADAVWQDGIEGRLPDDPAPLRESLPARAPAAPLGTLRKLVDAVRAREADVAHAAHWPEWLALRGALHQALALRGSRIALYDLRETIAAASDPLPATFLTALHLIGDEASLSPIAAAHQRAGDTRWRHQLEEAFRAIVKREKLSRKPVAKLLRKSP